MIGKEYLERMDIDKVNREIQNLKGVILRYQAMPESILMAGYTFGEAYADVFVEAAQLYRRAAELFDAEAKRMRSLPGEVF